jgi:hypothetical protein
MMPIDNVIAKMKNTGCMKCRCFNATFDETGVEVEIFGSFCNFTAGYDQIEITATRKNDNEVL